MLMSSEQVERLTAGGTSASRCPPQHVVRKLEEMMAALAPNVI